MSLLVGMLLYFCGPMTLALVTAAVAWAKDLLVVDPLQTVSHGCLGGGFTSTGGSCCCWGALVWFGQVCAVMESLVEGPLLGAYTTLFWSVEMVLSSWSQMIQVKALTHPEVMGTISRGGEGNWPEPFGVKWVFMVFLMYVVVSSL